MERIDIQDPRRKQKRIKEDDIHLKKRNQIEEENLIKIDYKILKKHLKESEDSKKLDHIIKMAKKEINSFENFRNSKLMEHLSKETTKEITTYIDQNFDLQDLYPNEKKVENLECFYSNDFEIRALQMQIFEKKIEKIKNYINVNKKLFN